MYTFIRQGRIILIDSDKDIYNAFEFSINQNHKDWSNDAVNTACITNYIILYI